MSIVSWLVLVLLCFSFHACNARTFGVVHKEQAGEFVQDSTSQKNESGMDPDCRVSAQPSQPKFAVPNASGRAKQEKKGNNESTDVGSSPQTKSSYQVKVSDTTRVESRESVSWKVPHKRRGEPEVPGFNLDYLPPRTHPPVHN